MNWYALKDIPPNYFFTKTVFLDDDFVVAAPEMPITPELIQTLSEWGFREVSSEGEPRSNYSDGIEQEEAGDTSIIDLSRVSALADTEKIRGAEDFCHELKVYVDELFSQVFLGDQVSFKGVAERVRDSLDRIKEDQRYLLRVLKNVENAQEDYLISHTVKSMIIAIIIGFYIKLPPHRLIELGVAALFHEIGMLKLPAKVYLSPNALSPAEQKVIYSHPILGYNTLKGYDFPLAVSIAALEHHERENGSGYPRRLTSDKISLYSKIIAVACSYEAISSYRPHREARDGYIGMLELLKNEGKQYDDTIIRALVYSLSIYPIGLYVLLSSGKKGQVVDVNPENPRFPIVQIFGELNPDGKNKTQETAQDGLRIVRPLTREEIGT
ncbi:MAG: HD-GYP domain-containing protein [Treponema sp.]|jgi:HD-GYP domain-containing protein (c-di-GMP phosphodiesterase class II)|nr:HD-GYP domain-containing protein [Treponema sp.]